MVRSMMAQANLLISFRGDALLPAAYILNRVPSKSVPSTPYELWTGNKPELAHLRPSGSASYVHMTSQPHGKLDPKSKKCIFIRYLEGSKGYVMLDERADRGLTEIESRNVDFLEKEFPNKGEIRKSFELYETEEIAEFFTKSLGEGG